MTEAKGRKPQDHKQSVREQHDLALEQENLLVDLPELTAPHKLRPRARGEVRAIMLSALASGVFEQNDRTTLSTGEITPDDVEFIRVADELVADIDEWAETIAVDPAAYADWAGGKSYDHFFALLNRYSDALGE